MNALNRYIDEFNIIITNPILNDEIIINKQTQLSGHCTTPNCPGEFTKSFFALRECGGPYCKKCTTINARKKLNAANTVKYGVPHAMQNKSVKQKQRII